jgi:hypothetical protein
MTVNAPAAGLKAHELLRRHGLTPRRAAGTAETRLARSCRATAEAGRLDHSRLFAPDLPQLRNKATGANPSKHSRVEVVLGEKIWW